MCVDLCVGMTQSKSRLKAFWKISLRLKNGCSHRRAWGIQTHSAWATLKRRSRTSAGWIEMHATHFRLLFIERSNLNYVLITFHLKSKAQLCVYPSYKISKNMHYYSRLTKMCKQPKRGDYYWGICRRWHHCHSAWQMIISHQALEQWEAAKGPGQLLHKVIYSRSSKRLSFHATVRGCCMLQAISLCDRSRTGSRGPVCCWALGCRSCPAGEGCLNYTAASIKLRVTLFSMRWPQRGMIPFPLQFLKFHSLRVWLRSVAHQCGSSLFLCKSTKTPFQVSLTALECSFILYGPNKIIPVSF